MAEEIINKLSGVIDKTSQLKTIKEEINELRQEVINTNGQAAYQDSSVFFDHIRNSFTHSYYRIDYTDMFSTSDFSKVKFLLEDFEEIVDKSKRKTFEIELTGEDLVYLMSEIQSRLNESITNNGKISLENIHLDMLRDEQGIQRYDYTKYDSENHPIVPTKKANTRPTNEDFEENVDEEILMKGLVSNALEEMQTAKNGEEKQE